MRKNIVIMVLTFALTVLLCGCSGNVSNVKIRIGESNLYTYFEIEQAMNIAIQKFKSDFDGCTLTEMAYVEDIFSKAAMEWAAQYNADEAIVLVSSFQVGLSGGEGSLNPNSTYNNWQWILTRNAGGRWQLQTWGYG